MRVKNIQRIERERMPCTGLDHFLLAKLLLVSGVCQVEISWAGSVVLKTGRLKLEWTVGRQAFDENTGDEISHLNFCADYRLTKAVDFLLQQVPKCRLGHPIRQFAWSEAWKTFDGTDIFNGKFKNVKEKTIAGSQQGRRNIRWKNRQRGGRWWKD